jgi:hypothetical protein
MITFIDTSKTIKGYKVLLDDKAKVINMEIERKIKKLNILESKPLTVESVSKINDEKEFIRHIIAYQKEATECFRTLDIILKKCINQMADNINNGAERREKIREQAEFIKELWRRQDQQDRLMELLVKRATTTLCKLNN